MKVSAVRMPLALVGLTALSILTGYLREACIAAWIGAGRTADSYFLAMSIVTTMVDLLPGAALLSSIVPVLAPLVRDDASVTIRRAVVTTVAGVLGAATIGLALAIVCLVPLAAQLMAPGFNAGGLAWYVPLQAMAIFFTLVLNAHQRFILAATMPVLGNILFVATLTSFGKTDAGHGVMVATLLGPAAAVAILGTALLRARLLAHVGFADARPELMEIWRLARPSLLSLGIGSSIGLVIVCHLLLRSYSLQLGPGAVSALTYAFRLYEVPVSLVANVAATAALPMFSALHGQVSDAAILRRVRTLILWGGALLLPVAFAVFVAAPVIVELLFKRGQFSDADVARTAEALQGFAPAIVLEATIVVLYRVAYALRRPFTPVFFSGAVLAILFLLLAMFGRAGTQALALCFSASLAISLIAIPKFVGRLSNPGS